MAGQLPPHEISDPLARLCNVACSSLLSEPQFEAKDEAAQRLSKAVEDSVKTDPEFCFKLCYYLRQTLGVRTTSNHILAQLCTVKECHPFVRRYFPAIIVLPSDLLQFFTFFFKLRGSKTIPQSVRKATQDRFLLFTPVQLAKYNNVNRQRRIRARVRLGAATGVVVGRSGGAAPVVRGVVRGRAGRGVAQADRRGRRNVAVKRKIGRRRTAKKPVPPEKANILTLKHVVRLCHIARPAEIVASIIGKKYPADAEKFAKTGFSGEFDPARVGKRMKLPSIVTWERKLSERGNTWKSWEDLILSKRLPFMAMLRNLRNILDTGVGAAVHEKVLEILTDEKAVTSSRQFPFRFLSAYEAISSQHFTEGKLQQMAQKATNGKAGSPLTETENVPKTNARKFAEALKQLQGMGFTDTETNLLLLESHRGNVEAVVEALLSGIPPRVGSVPTRTVKRPVPKEPVTAELLRRYREALDTALKLATVNNLPALRGHTVVLCDVSGSMDQPCSVAAGLGAGSSVRTVLDVACLLGLMINYASESCEIRLFGSSPDTAPENPCHVAVPVPDDAPLFEAFEICKAQRKLVDSGTQFPYDLLAKWSAENTAVDNLILLSDMMISPTPKTPPAPVATRVVWEWQSGGFQEFDAATSANLEEAFSAGKPKLLLDADPRSKREIDFAGMTQENLQTHRKRPIRRRLVPLAAPATEEGCPFNLEEAISSYRANVNPSLRFICIDLLGTGRAQVGARLDPESEGHNILISGFSDSVLRFLATQAGDQVAAVRAIVVPERVPAQAQEGEQGAAMETDG